jgi:hypothetical protein
MNEKMLIEVGSMNDKGKGKEFSQPEHISMKSD